MRGALALPAPLGGVDVGELRGAEVAHHLELLQLVIGPGQVQGGGAEAVGNGARERFGLSCQKPMVPKIMIYWTNCPMMRMCLQNHMKNHMKKIT